MAMMAGTHSPCLASFTDSRMGEKPPSALEYVAKKMGLDSEDEILPDKDALVLGIGETMNEVRRVTLRAIRESFQGKQLQ